MGLDIYVGSLSRYYARDWELIAQKIARELGMDFQVVYKNEPENISQDEIRPNILSWRDAVKEAMKTSLEEGETMFFNWDETPESEYYTDKPDWDGYGALLLWAAYTEHQDLSVPELIEENWHEDEAFNQSCAENFETQFPALLKARMWIPEKLPRILSVQDITGKKIIICSAIKLGLELYELNNKTWKADTDTIAKWRDIGPSETGDLEEAAKFGFTIFWDLSIKAIKNNLVMMLDY